MVRLQSAEPALREELEKEVDAGLIGGLAAGAVDIDIDAFVAHMQADDAEPAAAATVA